MGTAGSSDCPTNYAKITTAAACASAAAFVGRPYGGNKTLAYASGCVLDADGSAYLSGTATAADGTCAAACGRLLCAGAPGSVRGTARTQARK